MKLFKQLVVAVFASALCAAPASADYMYPFGGWWGVGYYGTPVYASYGTSYTTNYAPSYGCCGTPAPSYVASYGSSYGSGCCASSCCDPCGGCGSGLCGSGCASGSCAGTVPAGSLKPAQDPISDKAKENYENDSRSRQFDPDTRDRSRPIDDRPDPLLDDPDKIDQFRSPSSGGSSGSKSGTGFFDETPVEDRLNQKPAITDPMEDVTLPPTGDESGAGKDQKTFLDEPAESGSTTSRTRSSLLARSSSLSEVISPKRLAGRSLPSSTKTVSNSKLTNKASGSEAVDAQRPLRWISAPLPEGNVRL